MGCKYACTCSGNCLNCEVRESEEYFGHAEDIMAQAHGYKDSYEMDEEYIQEQCQPEQMQPDFRKQNN